jgi:hypothetical protein
VSATPPQPVEADGVRFEGDFRPTEREFLASQFGDCRFRLLARSVLGAPLALVEWEGAPVRGAGPQPLAGAPRRATYVLDGAAAGGPTGVAWSGMRLDRVDGPGELATRFPGHFPDARLTEDWRDRLNRAVKDVWPALMLVVASVWLLAVLWACRPFG